MAALEIEIRQAADNSLLVALDYREDVPGGDQSIAADTLRTIEAVFDAPKGN